MRELFNKMREMSIKELKLRRQKFFEHTRQIIMEKGYPEDEESMSESREAPSMEGTVAME